MVYKFRLISDEVKDFVRDVELLSGQNFYDFHKLLVEDLNYDITQIASFFLTNNNWEKQREFTLFDMSEESGFSSVRMDKALLRDYIEEDKQRFLYIFDFFNERGLFIELVETGDQNNSSKYPRITFSSGNPPVQILGDSNNFGDFTFDE